MSSIMDEQFKYALERVSSATDEELVAIPEHLFNKLGILEVSSGQLRLAYDPDLRTEDPKSKKSTGSNLQQAGQGASIQSMASDYDKEALPYPKYPDQDWQFTVEPSDDEPDEDQEGAEGGEKRGVCQTPGTSYKVRAGILNTAIITMAVKDNAEQVCNETVLFNVSLACIVTDVIAFVAHGINENQALCNKYVGAAEVSAGRAGNTRANDRNPIMDKLTRRNIMNRLNALIIAGAIVMAGPLYAQAEVETETVVNGYFMDNYEGNLQLRSAGASELGYLLLILNTGWGCTFPVDIVAEDLNRLHDVLTPSGNTNSSTSGPMWHAVWPTGAGPCDPYNNWVAFGYGQFSSSWSTKDRKDGFAGRFTASGYFPDEAGICEGDYVAYNAIWHVAGDNDDPDCDLNPYAPNVSGCKKVDEKVSLECPDLLP